MELLGSSTVQWQQTYGGSDYWTQRLSRPEQEGQQNDEEGVDSVQPSPKSVNNAPFFNFHLVDFYGSVLLVFTSLIPIEP